MRPILFVSVVATLVSAVLGCSSGSEAQAEGTSSSASATNADSFCESYCTKINECDSSSDLQTCTETCGDSLESTVRKLRADLMTEVQSCWEASDCRKVLGGDRLGDCVDEAAVSAAPNANAKAFCDDLGESLAKCDLTVDRARCLDTVKVFGDDAVAQATKCTTKSCATIMGCVDASL